MLNGNAWGGMPTTPGVGHHGWRWAWSVAGGWLETDEPGGSSQDALGRTLKDRGAGLQTSSFLLPGLAVEA